MTQDRREFTVKVAAGKGPVYNTTRMWAALEAVEGAVGEVSPSEATGVHEYVIVKHGTGSLSRPTVAEAMAAVERNGFYPASVAITFTQLFGEIHKATWVKVSTWDAHFGRHVKVEVMYGSEVEVNGLYTLLQNAVTAATRDDHAVAAGDGRRRSTWVTLTTHPLIVTVVGGVIAAAIIAWVGLNGAK